MDRFNERRRGRPLPRSVVERLTGARHVRYAPDGVCSSDLAAKAAMLALSAAGVDADAVDLLIFAAASHDLAEPATVNRVQLLTGCSRARGIDVKNACNSFLDGLDVARCMLELGQGRVAVVACGEVLSPFVELGPVDGVDDSELLAGLTLGDAGAAAVLGTDVDGGLVSLAPGVFETQGQHWDACRINAGGSMTGRRFDEAFFVSDSRRIFDLAVAHVPNVVRAALSQEGWEVSDVDLVVSHQASTEVVRRIARDVGIPFERCVITGDAYGNTAAASIPVALSVAAEDGRLGAAKRTILVGGAAGFSSAALPLHGCGQRTG